jgi:hypothetical protein
MDRHAENVAAARDHLPLNAVEQARLNGAWLPWPAQYDRADNPGESEVSALVFGRDAEGYGACLWPPAVVDWWGPRSLNDLHGLCPLPPERCEWEGCELPQDYEAGHHVYCTFHGEVRLHEAAREWNDDAADLNSAAQKEK